MTPSDPNDPEVRNSLASLIANVQKLLAMLQASKLDKFCNAIKQFEGWYIGSPSYRNNNPGNMRYGSYAASYGAYAASASGFAIFRTYDAGMTCLKQFVTDCANQKIVWSHGGLTVLEYFAGKLNPATGKIEGGHAPSSDGNNPLRYATYVAKQTGVTVDTPLIQILS